MRHVVWRGHVDAPTVQETLTRIAIGCSGRWSAKCMMIVCLCVNACVFVQVVRIGFSRRDPTRIRLLE